jgi:hypothetical protein
MNYYWNMQQCGKDPEKIGYLRITLTMRCVRATIVAVEEHYVL